MFYLLGGRIKDKRRVAVLHTSKQAFQFTFDSLDDFLDRNWKLFDTLTEGLYITKYGHNDGYSRGDGVMLIKIADVV